MNLSSEFTIDLWADDLTEEHTTWRWLPHDPRAQHLYRDGALPDDVKADFEAQCDNASVYIGADGASIYYEPQYTMVATSEDDPTQVQVETTRPATADEKRLILDGFLWVSRGGSISTLPEQDTPEWWAGHLHPTDKKLITEAEFHVLVDARDKQHAADVEVARQASLVAAGAAWDARLARYVKLGWDEADVVAEFGPRPGPIDGV